MTRTEKVLVFGERSTGKTAIIECFLYGPQAPHITCGIGARYDQKSVLVDDERITLQIWDTVGRSRLVLQFDSRGAGAAIFVFDVTSERAFAGAEELLSSFREHAPSTAIVIGAANKVDLANNRVLSKEAIDEFAAKNHLALVMETSASSGQGVTELFTEAARRIVRHEPEPEGVIIEAEATRSYCCQV